MTVELWETLNRLYLFLQGPAARRLWDESPSDFFQEIRNSSLPFQGMADATVVRNEGWLFMQAGRFIERADKTSRMVDVHHASVSGEDTRVADRQADVLTWSAMLRSYSAWDAYKALHGAEVQPLEVAEFLLLSENFPRSMRFCLEQLNSALRRISGVPEGRFSNEAEKLCGRLLAELQFSSGADLFRPDLHTCIDSLQGKLNAVDEALFQAYIFQSFSSGPDGEWRQQEEQQQQTRLSAPLPRPGSSAFGSP